MSKYQMGVIESRFADIIWEREPIASPELAKLAEEMFNWKKSTTYTVLRRLCEKELFINDNGIVRSLLPRSEFYARQSESYVKDSFSGSLPAFLAAFTSRKKLSADEIEELQRIIREAKLD